MFATKQDLNKANFRCKPPKQEVYEHLQNRKNKMINYRGNIPDRELTVKKGIFPFTIHANPVSKEVLGKDQRKPDPVNKESLVFLKPKNAFDLFDKKVPGERPLFENPSTSTGFFESTQHPTTPRNSKNHRDDDATFSTCSNTTEKNKLVLLNRYLTVQYNAVLEVKAASNDAPKHINFNAEDAFQICAYKQIGEVLNQSFIEKNSEFECSTNMTASVQLNLRKLYFERMKEKPHSPQKSHTEDPKNAIDENESPPKQTASSDNELLDEKHAEDGIKSDVKNGNFRLKDPVLKTDVLTHRKGNKICDQSNEGNDKACSPHQRNMPQKRARNLATPPPTNNRNFIREFEIKKHESFMEKLAECDDIYKKSPLFPVQHEYSKPEFKPVNTPTLFFSDTDDSSVSLEVDKNDTQPPKNNFTLDSAVFTRKFSPELFNPIDIIGTRAKSPEVKKNTHRRKVITPLSDSSRHRVPFKRYKKSVRDEYATKHDNYSKFNLKNEKYNLF